MRAVLEYINLNTVCDTDATSYLRMLEKKKTTTPPPQIITNFICLISYEFRNPEICTAVVKLNKLLYVMHMWTQKIVCHYENIARY